MYYLQLLSHYYSRVEEMQQRLYGLQIRKHVLHTPLQKKLTDPLSKIWEDFSKFRFSLKLLDYSSTILFSPVDPETGGFF